MPIMRVPALSKDRREQTRFAAAGQKDLSRAGQVANISRNNLQLNDTMPRFRRMGYPKMSLQYSSKPGPMRIQARPRSLVERRHYLTSASVAGGLTADPSEDLVFHGGKIVPQMEFQNVYLGPNWQQSDVTSIDSAITLAMQFAPLNAVMAQYFHGSTLSCDPRNSFIARDTNPATIDEPGVQTFVTQLYDQSLISKSDLDTAIFNLILPRGTILKLDGDTSLDGLGGYHGSIHIVRGGKSVTLYYSANVFSETTNGQENGIVAFDAPWKNVVATLYHEINEFRTDPDVTDAVQRNNDAYLGWSSRSGKEVGDQPLVAAADLNQVFQEIACGNGKTVPVQFLYSNAVHGAEGPSDVPIS
jgi:hypothetical protein